MENTMPNYEISSTHYSFICSPEEGLFHITSNRIGLANLKNCRLKVRLRKNNKEYTFLNQHWYTYQVIKTANDTSQGKLKQLEFSSFVEEEGLIFRITFAVSEDYPLFLWKIIVENQSDVPVFIEDIYLLETRSSKVVTENYVQFGNELIKPDFSFHSHGWQSWSFSGSYLEGEKQVQTRLGFLLDPMLKNPGTPRFKKPGMFSSDFFGVLAERTTRTGLVLGFLSQKQHFGTITADIRSRPELNLWANGDQTRVDPSNRMETDWAVFHTFYLDQIDPLQEYYTAVQREHDIHLPNEMPAGWCSWYYYYQDISEQKIKANFDEIKNQKNKLPISLVQIDDGFEKQVGDWYKFDKGFPNGVKPLAEQISKEGYTPGLWLAPFILHPRSEFVLDHPEMILRNSSGAAVYAGFVWNTFTQALDLSYPDALEYAVSVVETAAKDWGFPYLKLDFLYAGALPGKRFDQTKTRAQILRHAMEKIRERVGPETFLLGCGVPLGSVLGLVEANRIGEDVSGDWTPKYFGLSFPFTYERGMPSARNAIQNVLTRAEQHQRWWINDPDCLLVREESNLTLAEIQSLASAIAITGGSLLISDDLTTVSPERLRIAEVLMPVIGKRAYVMDWLDTTTPHNLRLDLENQTGFWQIIGRFNWKEIDREIFISFPDYCMIKNEYWAYSFWDDQVYFVNDGDPLNIPNIPKHGVAMIGLRSVNPGKPIYLGSNLHISMGLEVSSWTEKRDGLDFKIKLPRSTSGHITLALPKEPKTAFHNQHPLKWQTIRDGVYRFDIIVSFETEISISW
ncbi:MAG: hypothetical protein CL609_15970 [Anaerolineaceae bacterium]|nr:hypothetical protein [Anaerolineaceae bacterium]